MNTASTKRGVRTGSAVLLALVFVFLAGGMTVAGYLFYEQQKRSIQEDRKNELVGLAQLKVSQIASWRRETIADGEFIRENPFVNQALARLLSGVAQPDLRRQVLAWMMERKARRGYARLLLADANGVLILSTSPDKTSLGPGNLSLVTQAMSTRKVVLGDLHRNAVNFIHMDLCVPIFIDERSAPLGALLAEVDPRQSLYPLIETWPTPSRSAESLLMRREGAEVLFLNELRHRKNTALLFRRPLGKTVLSALAGAPGGAVEARDYRGVPVVAAVRAVPDSPWILVAKLDVEEIYSPIRQRALITALVGGLLFALAATGVLLLWGRREGRFYQRQYRAEIERQALVRRLENLNHDTNDIILLADPSGRILDANRRAVSSYGFEHHELIGMTLKELRSAEARSSWEADWTRLKTAGNLTFETCHRRKDQSRFPVEISARGFTFDAGRYYQFIIRDLTERKAAEAQLLDAHRKTTSLLESISDGFNAFDREWRYTYVNAEGARMIGKTPEELLGRELWEVWPEAENSPFGVAYHRAADENVPVHVEAFFSPLNAWFDVRCYPSAEGLSLLYANVTKRKKDEERLRLLESAALQTNDGLLIVTTSGEEACCQNPAFLNPAFERITGYSLEDLQHGAFPHLYRPGQNPHVIEGRGLGFRRTCPKHFQQLAVRKDGSEYWAEWSFRPLTDNDGNYTHCVWTCRDVTERNRAEETSRLLSSIVASSDDAIISKTMDGIVTSWNKGAERIYGYSAEEMVGHSISVLFPEDRADEFRELMAYLNLGERIEHLETERVRKDGERIFVSVTVSPIRDASNRTVGASTIARDVTERKRSETALQLSEERYRSLTIVSTQIVWTTNALGEVVDDIPMWREFTGQSLDEVKGWGWINALHPADRERTVDIWSRSVKNRSVYRTEYRMRRKDGDYRWMSVHGVPVFEEKGAIREWVGTCADVTDRRQAEQAIHKLNDDLEKRVIERTAEWEAANRELEAFAYSVSHDLRAPLRAIDGFSRILLEDYSPLLPPEAQRYLQVARDNALQMGSLIDGLLAFSRLTRHPLSDHRVDLAGLVKQVVKGLRAEREGRKVEIVVGEIPDGQGDAQLLKQVFVNLLSNAHKYTRTREVARIEIGATTLAELTPAGRAAAPADIQDDSSTVYIVRDNGVGFDMRYRDKLFGVFQRLHRAEEFEGTGVGLATVQRIIHRHGGRVWAEAEVDRGAAFYFTLGAPRQNQETLPEEQPESNAALTATDLKM